MSRRPLPRSAIRSPSPKRPAAGAGRTDGTGSDGFALPAGGSDGVGSASGNEAVGRSWGNVATAPGPRVNSEDATAGPAPAHGLATTRTITTTALPPDRRARSDDMRPGPVPIGRAIGGRAFDRRRGGRCGAPRPWRSVIAHAA